MPAAIVARSETAFTIQIEVPYGSSMLDAEEALQQRLNEAGTLATGVTSEECNRLVLPLGLHAATGNPYRSILPQNCDHRSLVYVRHRKLNTAAAPGSFHLIPDPHSRCFTSTLHAASVTPLPIGTFAATSGA